MAGGHCGDAGDVYGSAGHFHCRGRASYIAGSVSATNDEATWVLTSYLVANAIVLPASGWFALRFGRKRFLIACIVIFTASSFACGAATSLAMILIARAVQGAGGGALQPLSQAILLESFPPEKRGRRWRRSPSAWWWRQCSDQRWEAGSRLLTGGVGRSTSTSLSGILAVFMISRQVKDPKYIREAKPGKFDAIGLGLLAVWLGALQIILEKGRRTTGSGPRGFAGRS